MAAGMGSRFGGMKQLTPLTDEGEFIMDFTIYDASDSKSLIKAMKKYG